MNSNIAYKGTVTIKQKGHSSTKKNAGTPALFNVIARIFANTYTTGTSNLQSEHLPCYISIVCDEHVTEDALSKSYDYSTYKNYCISIDKLHISKRGASGPSAEMEATLLNNQIKTSFKDKITKNRIGAETECFALLLDGTKGTQVLAYSKFNLGDILETCTTSNMQLYITWSLSFSNNNPEVTE